MQRKFEYVRRMIDTGNETIVPTFNLPKRMTENSAGYDFFLPKDTLCKSHEITLVPTGVKVNMQNDEALILANRSSNSQKKGLIIPNGIGIIDADYFSNQDNDGEICALFYNINDTDILLNKNDRIMQGIFTKFLIVDNDNSKNSREGGFGSTK